MVKHTERGDTEWYAAIIGHDAGAWLELQHQLYLWILNYLMIKTYWLPSGVVTDLAEECTQDASIRLMQRVDQYERRGEFLGWCRIVAINVVRDRLRVEARRSASDEWRDLESVAISNRDHGEETRILLAEVVESIVEFTETGLTDNERRVFIALAQDEQTPVELARTMNTSRNNIYQIWFRARSKVRQHLEAQGYSEGALRELQLLT